MGKDPAFLFYPGDYLRDTQCLSANAQVAYDRIMCEHMRNICISQQQLNFFTKRLSDDEKEEIMHLLRNVDGGFQIEWVAESISKRRNYSESRRKNRSGKNKKHMLTYVKHMENENENENVNENKGGVGEKNKIPSLQEFLDYAHEVLGAKFNELKFSLESKYQAWVDNGWKDGNGRKIKNWKTSIRNTIPYLKPFVNEQQTSSTLSNIKKI